MIRHLTTLAALLVLIVISRPASGQKAVPSPIVAPPQAPTLTPVAPYGATPGSTIELTLTGTNLAQPLAVLPSFPAKVTIPTDAKNGTEPTKFRAVLEIPADAPMGVHTLRVATAAGVSNLRPFCLDPLPLTLEQPTNRVKTTPQTVTLPTVIAGQIDGATSDFYKVAVPAGQTLCVDLLAHRIGSALDSVVFLHDAASGRELGIASDDAPGLEGDSRLIFTAKEARELLIEIRDSTYRGGAEYVYRMRLGNFPGATAAVPAAITRGQTTNVSFAGTHLDGVAPVSVTAPADPTVPALSIAPRGPAQIGWPVTVLLSDLPELVEQEPNGSPAQAQKVAVPVGLTGRFQSKGETDHVRFPATKGTKYVVNVQTAEIGSPAEVYFTVADAKGAVIAKSDPTKAPRVEVTPAADGDLVVAIEHLNYEAGPHQVYRMTIEPAGPRLTATLDLDRFALSPGATTSIPISSLSRVGLEGPVEFTVVGPAGLSGSVTVPANAPAPTPGQPFALIPLTAQANLAPGAYEFKVIARGTAGGKPLTEIVGYQPLLSQLFGGMSALPLQLNGRLAVGIAPPPPFQLRVKATPEDPYPGGPAVLTVTATRDAMFAEEIALAVAGLPNGVAAPKVVNIAKDKPSGTATLTLGPKTPAGAYDLAVVATTKVNGQPYAITTAPVSVTVGPPFLLTVTPPAKLAPGMKAKLTVAVARKGGYAGPIALALPKLPAGVTAAAVTIAAGKDSGEIELTAAANAAEAMPKDVIVQGTATAAGNLVQASAPFALTVAK
jgi:hypothetical protein